MKFSIKKLLVATGVIAFAVWLINSAYVGVTKVETGENAASVDWLPESASNISYYRSYMFTAYEFDITEANFVSWSTWDTDEINDPVRINRYTLFANELPGLAANPTAAEFKKFAEARAEQSAAIDDGLHYGYLQDNGGGIWVGYDRRLGRAFYQSAPR